MKKEDLKLLLGKALKALENVGLQDHVINYDFVAKVKREIKQALNNE